MKQLKLLFIFTAFSLSAAAQSGTVSGSSAGSEKWQSSDGLEYKIIKDNKGKKAKIGDVVEINVIIKIEDSLLANSVIENKGKAIPLTLSAPIYHGDWLTGLTFMSEGDSAVFRASVDSIQKAFPNQQMPPFMKEGRHLIYEVKMVSIKSAAEMKAATDKTMQDYFKKNNLHPQKTTSGLYYIIKKQGLGSQVTKGDSVIIKYTGRTFDDHIFDTNIDSSKGHAIPLGFRVGAGMMIPGMDEGVTVLKKGSKARLYLPSNLAYGQASPSAEIPANSNLIFDVEILDVKK